MPWLHEGNFTSGCSLHAHSRVPAPLQARQLYSLRGSASESLSQTNPIPVRAGRTSYRSVAQTQGAGSLSTSSACPLPPHITLLKFCSPRRNIFSFIHFCPKCLLILSSVLSALYLHLIFSPPLPPISFLLLILFSTSITHFTLLFT
jgi:hypothetical protein